MEYGLIHYIISLTTISEYGLYCIFLLINIKSPGFKKIAVFVSIIFIFFLGWYYLTVPIKVIDSIPIGIETILILLIAFYFLYEKMNDPTTTMIYNDYRFWIVFGMIIYLAGSFFIYIFAGQLKLAEFKKYLMLPYVFYILKNILFAVSIIIFAKTKQQYPEKIKNDIPYLDIN